MLYCQYFFRKHSIPHLHTDLILNSKQICPFYCFIYIQFKWTALFCTEPLDNQKDYIYGALKMQYNNNNNMLGGSRNSCYIIQVLFCIVAGGGGEQWEGGGMRRTRHWPENWFSVLWDFRRGYSWVYPWFDYGPRSLRYLIKDDAKIGPRPKTQITLRNVTALSI